LDIESGYLPVDGTQIYYETAGQGEPLVLLHGNMLDSRMWDFNFLPLAQHFRVIRYDQRGYGKSGASNGRLGTADSDLLALLDHLHIPTAHVCGSSMGGVVATHFAFLHPERTAGLILVNTDLSGFATTGDLADAILETRLLLEKADKAGAVRLWLGHPLLLPTQRYPQAYEHIQKIVADYNWENWLAGKSYLITPPVLKRLGEIQARTLVVTGENDLPRFAAIAELLCRKIPRSQRQIMADTAHLSCLEKPEDFNELVIQFLRSKLTAIH